MGILNEDIERFLTTDYGDGSGSGSGSGCSNGSGYSYNYSGDCGEGFDSGDGYGSIYTTSYGGGYGSGYGDGDGSGCSSSDGSDVKSLNGNAVYMVDAIPTIFENIHGNVAKGYILQISLQLTPCFIIKNSGKFAHGLTLHEAWQSLQEKLYENYSIEERITEFKKHFTDFDHKYAASELFLWHHVLTGSCKAGREAFCHDHGIDVNKDSFTIKEFIKLTENSYGGNIIKQLKNMNKNI